MEISPKMQQQLAQFEQLRQQIQLIANQRLNLEARTKELELANTELEKLDDATPIYRNIGSLMVKVPDRKELIGKIKEEQETVDIRIKTVKKQEEQLRARYDELQEKIASGIKKLQDAS